MSFAYPIYEDRVNKTNVRFYHCSNKRSNARTLKTDYPAGSILNEKQELLFSPTYHVVDKFSANSESISKCKIHDCTVVNLYYMDDEWYYGTKNSWNIRNLRDFTQTTYGQFFARCLENYPQFSFDSLDKEQMYTIAFTNPECHFMSNEYKIYVYNSADSLADVFDVLEPADENAEEYISVCNVTGEITITQSKLRETATNLLYSNRNKCYAKELMIARAKVVISALCNCATNIKSDIFSYYQKQFNTIILPIYEDVMRVGNQFELENTVKDKFLDVDIPVDLVNISQENSIFDAKFIGFYVSIFRISMNL